LPQLSQSKALPEAKRNLGKKESSPIATSLDQTPIASAGSRTTVAWNDEGNAPTRKTSATILAFGGIALQELQ